MTLKYWDQFNFAKIGVPAMHLKAVTDFVDCPPGWGESSRTTTPSSFVISRRTRDDPSWSFDGLVDDELFGYWVGLAIANADEIPVWRPGDEFRAARLDALESSGKKGTFTSDGTG